VMSIGTCLVELKQTGCVQYYPLVCLSSPKEDDVGSMTFFTLLNA